MFLAGLFITVPYSVSYLAFAITGKADRKLPIVMNSSRHLHSFYLFIQLFISAVVSDSSALPKLIACHSTIDGRKIAKGEDNTETLVPV